MAANNVFRSSITPQDVQAVSPALANYTKAAIVDGIWNSPGLSRRDRSILTVATLIARMQTIGMEHYFTIALDSGVTPAELSEIVTHLAVLLRVVECVSGSGRFARHLRTARHQRRSASCDLARAAAAERGVRSEARCAGAGKLRRNITGRGREHREVSVSRLVAAAGA